MHEFEITERSINECDDVLVNRGFAAAANCNQLD